MFGALMLLTGVWEVGQHLQGAGVIWEETRWCGQLRRVWLIRASRLESVIIVAFSAVGVLAMGGLAMGALFFGSSTGLDHWKADALCVLSLIAAAVFVFGQLRRTRGIALLPEGIVWMDEKLPLFIAWSAIESVSQIRVASDVGHGIKIQLSAIGVRLRAHALDGVQELGMTPAPLKVKKPRCATQAPPRNRLRVPLYERIFAGARRASRVFAALFLGQSPQSRRIAPRPNFAGLLGVSARRRGAPSNSVLIFAHAADQFGHRQHVQRAVKYHRRQK